MPAKDEIIAAIQRVADEIGESPGLRTFAKHTGISEGAWKGVYWARWGEALEAAGLEANNLQQSHSTDLLLHAYCVATRQLGKPPTTSDLRLLKRYDPNLPSATSYRNKFGTFEKLRAAARDWALQNEDLKDVLHLLPASDNLAADGVIERLHEGWVYLLRSGDYYKIGRGEDLERRVKQVSVALPSAVELVHAIQTDDAPGIENYWHRRFADRRANGEWFRLEANDVRAFKRRKFQ